jgi:hypothetical protein
MRVRDKDYSFALKHGAYSATAVLPTESKTAFRKFHQQIKAELNPTGALEENIVMEITRLRWRKANLATMSRSERVRRLLEKYGNVDLKTAATTIANAIKQAVASNEDEDGDESTIEKSKLKIERQLGFEDWVDDLRRESLVWQEVGEAGTLEGLKKELDVGERLDSAIMRCLKQLLMIRGIKSITAAPPASSSPKQIPKRLRAA